MNVRPVETSDARQIVEIYNHYILTSHATFEIEEIDTLEMERRIEGLLSDGYPSVVAVEGNEVIGYAYGHKYRERAAYRRSVEVSVYVKPGFEKQAVASGLYEALFAGLSGGDYHAVIAGISLPNYASVRLHEKFGFAKVAHFREVGYKFGRWIDVGYWELLLNDDQP